VDCCSLTIKEKFKNILLAKRIVLACFHIQDLLMKFDACGCSLSGRRLKRIERTVLQEMTSLTSLNLSDNQLRLFPSCVGLTALRHLDISENCLSSVEFVEKMPQLEDLRVEGNGLKVG